MKIKQHNEFITKLLLMEEDVVHIRYVINQLKGNLAVKENLDADEIEFIFVGLNDFLQEISLNLSDVSSDEVKSEEFLTFVNNLNSAYTKLNELQQLLQSQNKLDGGTDKIQMLSNKLKTILSDIQGKMEITQEKGE